MESQLLGAKWIEEDLNLQLKRIIQESERLEEEIIQFKKKIDEGSIKSKFENSSRILDDILNRKRASSNRFACVLTKKKNQNVSLSLIKEETRKVMLKH